MTPVMLICLVHLLFFIKIFAKDKAENSKEPFLPECYLKNLDVTFSNNSTDSLKIVLITSVEPYSSETFNISQANKIVSDKNFNKGYRTIIYSHGWFDTVEGILAVFVAKLYYKIRGYNVLLVDSRSLLSDINYLRCARATYHIGVRVGKALTQMENAGLNIQTLELVGHSLGSHVVGFIGKSFTKITSRKIPDIVGLDPAGPCFVNNNKQDKLDKSDADFVQVIHTNNDIHGSIKPLGHVDFYLNGGQKQPFIGGYKVGWIYAHAKVVFFWRAAVLNPKKFVGIQCRSIQEALDENCTGVANNTMGLSINKTSGGIYHIKTASIYPYYINSED